MKNCKEMTARVLERRDAYVAGQRKTRKTAMRITSAVCAFAVFAAVGVGLWQGGVFNPHLPALEVPNMGTTDKEQPTAPPITIEKDYALAEPVYPEMVQRPVEYEQEAHDAWWNGIREQRAQGPCRPDRWHRWPADRRQYR